MTLSERLRRFVLNEFTNRGMYGYREGATDTGSGAGAVLAAEASSSRAEPTTGAGASPSIVPVATEVIGWRSWSLEVLRGAFLDMDYFLVGHYGRRWDGPTLVADEVPTPKTPNGVYARREDWDPYSHFGSMYMAMPQSSDPTNRVYGSVALSGRVIEGDNGYRAERGTIRDLWIPTLSVGPALDIGSILEQRYACTAHFTIPPFHHWYYL